MYTVHKDHHINYIELNTDWTFCFVNVCYLHSLYDIHSEKQPEIFILDSTVHTETVDPPIKDPPNNGQPPNNGHLSLYQCYGCSVF